jgi:hypothetical protein
VEQRSVDSKGVFNVNGNQPEAPGISTDAASNPRLTARDRQVIGILLVAAFVVILPGKARFPTSRQRPGRTA